MNDLEKKKPLPCWPCVVSTIVPMPMTEKHTYRDPIIDTFKAYRKGKTTLTVVPPDNKEADSGTKVIPLYPESNKRA